MDTLWEYDIIYTANHSWEMPIFIELHFIVGFANSIKKPAINTLSSQIALMTPHIVTWLAPL